MAIGNRLSLAWTANDRLALAVLVTAWAAALGWLGWTNRQELADEPAVHAAKVQQVRELIDPNTADAASLRRLPLVGPERARKIVEYRRQHATADTPAFRRMQDLLVVPEIGPGVLKRIQKHLKL